jgi:hypothetical protein
VKAEQQKLPEVTKADIEAHLLEDKSWAKEKGVTVLENKKARDADEDNNVKKGKKQKKVNDNKEEKNKEEKKKEDKKSKFSHDLNIMNSFNLVKILLPLTSDDIDKTVKELQEKLSYYHKISEEESKASPVK